MIIKKFTKYIKIIIIIIIFLKKTFGKICYLLIIKICYR